MKQLKRFFRWLKGLDWSEDGCAQYVAIFIFGCIVAISSVFVPEIIGYVIAVPLALLILAVVFWPFPPLLVILCGMLLKMLLFTVCVVIAAIRFVTKWLRGKQE